MTGARETEYRMAPRLFPHQGSECGRGFKSAFIRKEIEGSDHCPVGIEIADAK